MEKERDKIIDEILRSMNHATAYLFPDIYLKAVLKIKFQDKKWNEDWHSIRLVQDFMLNEGLAEVSEDLRNNKGTVVIITIKGVKVNDFGGWLKYKKEKSRNKEFVYKTIAACEGIVIILGTILGLFMQYKSSTIGKENLQLQDQLQVSHHQIDSLRNLLKKKEQIDTTKK